MPETPQTWWFDPVPVLKRQTLVGLAFAACIAAIDLLPHRPWWLFLLFIVAGIVALRLVGNLPPRLACLAAGGLAVVDADGYVTHIPLAVAGVRGTPKGCQVTWEDQYLPTPVQLPGFEDSHALMAAIEAARTEPGASPRTSRDMAARLPVVPVLTPWRWTRGAAYLLNIIGFPLLFTWFRPDGLRSYHMALLVGLMILPGFWIDQQRRKQPWVAVTPAGLWLLRQEQPPHLIPADAMTGARPSLWADSTVQTSDPDCPKLKIGTTPDVLSFVLTPGGAPHA